MSRSKGSAGSSRLQELRSDCRSVVPSCGWAPRRLLVSAVAEVEIGSRNTTAGGRVCNACTSCVLTGTGSTEGPGNVCSFKV